VLAGHEDDSQRRARRPSDDPTAGARSVAEGRSCDVEAVAAEGAVEEQACLGDRGLHRGERKGRVVRFRRLPELDDEDGVGLTFIDADPRASGSQQR